MFTLFMANGLHGQSYDLPCDANDNAINFGTGESSETLNGNIEDVIPFITDLSAGSVQNFGITGADSALFYKLNLDPRASFLRISWEGGSVSDLWVGLIGFEEPCPADTEYGEAVYQNPDDEELLSGDIEGGEVIFELCRLDFDEGDFDNLFLWVASSESGTFEIEVTQYIRPENDGCESTPENLGMLNHGVDLEEDFSNIWACRQNFQPGSAACALEFNDGAAVWFEFTTGSEVGEINVVIDNPDEVPMDIAIIENEGGDCENFTLARRGCENDQDDEEILMENIAVKPNTTYLIVVNTDPSDWNDNFTITVSACEPPENNLICDATDLNFPNLGSYNPDNVINFPGGIGTVVEGTTECAYAFYFDDPTAENSWFDFDCGHEEVERAVFYKLNVNEYATKLFVEYVNSDLDGPLAVQVFIVQDLPGDCSDLIFEEGIFTPPAEWGSCDFGGGDVLEIDLCEVDNEQYGQIYLWVASAIDDEGEFELSFRQEIAPYNDLCEDPTSADRGTGDLGFIDWDQESGDCDPPGAWWDTQTNRGACPLPFTFTGGTACFDFFEDNPTVWYEFTTGPDVEAVDIEIEHPGVEVSVAVFELDTECGTSLTAPGDWDEYCTQETGTVEFEQLRVKPNTTYYILVSTSQDDWGEFEICVGACEAPENYNVCQATELNFPTLGAYNPDNAINFPGFGTDVDGTTECAYGFWNDEELTALIEFDCGDEYQHAVFYKLNIDEYASKIEIELNGLSAGTMSAQVFFLEDAPDCVGRDFPVLFFSEHGECNFNGSGTLVIDFCPLWADPTYEDFAFHENMYLWIATDLEDQGTFEFEVRQEIAPYNDECEDLGNADRGSSDIANGASIEWNSEFCLDEETNRGACPLPFNFIGLPPCFDFFEDNPTVWYEFTTGANVEAVDITVEHPGVDVSVAVFELDEPCGATLTAPGDWEDYCSQENGTVEFEQLRVKSNTTYYILVSTSEDDWGEFEICVEACEAPENYNICEASDLDFPGLGAYNPDDPINFPGFGNLVEGTTECAYGFWDNEDLTNLNEFDCGDQYEHAVFYKLNIDEFASKVDITINPTTAGTMSAYVFFWEGNEDCDTRGFDLTWFNVLDHGICDFTGEVTIEIDFCPLWADPAWEDFDFPEHMYLWIATDLDDQGEFTIEITQEIAPYNNDCEDGPGIGPGDLGTIEVGDEECLLNETNRGACPILYTGPSACLEGFPDEEEAGVWYTFETGENVELITIEIEHSNNGLVRIAMFELPEGCGETGLFPPNQAVEEYCVEIISGVDSIWNVLVQQNTQYFILVSTPIEDWGPFDICVRNCEPPENDRLCDVDESTDPEIFVIPGIERVTDGVYERREIELEGTTRCANNFFQDFNLNYEDFGCGPEFESAVFYKINLAENATELTVTGRALGDLNTLAFGLFFIGEEACDGERNFMPEIWLDPFMEEMLDCNAEFDGEIVFDLCGMTVEDKENMYLWVSTPRNEQGDFELEFSQKLGPIHDDCEEPHDFGIIESDEDEILCMEEIDAPRTNRWGCEETFDPSLVDNTLEYDLECFEDPIEAEISGVWYRFETDEDAGRLDMEFFHYSEGDEVRFVLFTPNPDQGELCEAWIIEMCEETEDGEIFFEDEAIQPNTVYYMLFYSDKEIGDDYDLCINVKPPRECLGIAPYFYNHTEIICGLSELEGFCLFMGPPFPPSFTTWPGCEFCCGFHNPQWFTFVAGEAASLSIDVEITECIGQGVQIAMYELDCEVPFDPTETSPGIQPTADMLISNCNLVSAPQTGVVNFTVNNVVPGQVYGIVVDGWSNAVCKVEVIEVLVGGDPPELDDDLLGEPEFDNTGFGFQPGDTICAGALEVPFALVQEVDGACTYIWTLDGEIIEDVEDPISITLDFPDPGTYEVCVSATNLCAFTTPKCVEVVVAPLLPDIQVDTLCRRETFFWEGPFGPIGAGILGPFNDAGDFEFQDFTSNTNGCEVEAFLDIHVIHDNYDNPTELYEVICWDDDPVYVPFEDHPQAQFFNLTGVYGEDKDLFITQEGSPGSEFECDSFFILELINLDILAFFDEPYCLDSLIYVGISEFFFPGGLEDFGYDAEIEIYYELIRESDDSIITSGNSIGLTTLFGGIFVEIPVSEFGGEVQTFRIDFYLQYDGLPAEPCERSFSINVDPNEYVPTTPELDAPDLACIGDEIELLVTNPDLIDEDYVWTFSQQPDTIFGDPDRHEISVIFSEAGTVEVCVFATNRCADSGTTCHEITISEPPVTDAGPDGVSCTFEHTFEGGGDDGFWTMLTGPLGGTSTFADNTDPQTTVTVTEKGTYEFMWTEVIGNLQGCRGRDTLSVQFLNIPEPINILYECDSLGLEYIATFEIIGETGPYTVVSGPGSIDGNLYTSPPTPDLTPINVIIADGNGCESELIVLIERCDCPTAVGQLNPTALNLCDGECFETLPFYNDATQVFVPGQDTVLFFLQTTNAFSVDDANWIDVNDDGIFCNQDLPINIGTTYYVYVAVGPIDTLTGFIDLDLGAFDNCTRISQRKPITWRAQPVAFAVSDTICGEVLPALGAVPSFGTGTWSQVSGPGQLTFGGINDPTSGLEADLCGTYTIQWHEQNFQCVDSIQVDIHLNCIPELGDVISNCDNEDISYFLSFEILSGTAPFTLVEPENLSGFFSGNTFTHPEMPNSGEELDIFYFVDVNGCELEVIIDVNCDCQPFPGIMDDQQINLCETETQVTAGPLQEDPVGEPGDIGTYVLHTSPVDQLGTIFGIDDNGVFNFDPGAGMSCGTIYYISYVIGPPDADGNVDFNNGCTRVAPGQPVLWYCEPTVDAGEDVTVCGSELAQLNGSSTFGTGQWSGGAGTIGNPDNPNTSYLPDESEYAGTVTLTYTTFADDGVCPDLTDVIVITVERPRVADAGADQVFCEIEAVQLNADSEGVSGMWSGGSGTFTNPNQNSTVYTPDPSEQGTTITLTWTTDAGDECPAVSDEMTIQIVDELTSVPGEDRIACFLSTQLSAVLPGNLDGVWSSADGGVVFGDINNPNSEVTVPSLGTFCFDWTISIGDCEDTDQVCITFVDAPEASWEIECNDIGTEYRVIFTISNGDQATYSVNGENVGGGTEFISDWITSGTQVSFVIDDENNCDPFDAVIEHECECLTEVGQMADPDAVTLCEDETFNFSTFYDASDEFLDPNDIRVYLLHDGGVANVGNVIAQNTSGQFGFQAGMSLEQSYFVTVAVGDELGSTNTIDFNDGCLLYSTGVEVIWYGYPSAEILPPAILTCAVTSVTITAATADAPYISYQWSGPGIVSGQDERIVTVDAIGTYTLVITDTRAGCESSESIDVRGDFEDPDAVIVAPDFLTCAVTQVTLDGSGSSSGNMTYEWTGPGIVSGQNTNTVVVSEIGSYTLTVIDNDNGCSSTISVTVQEDVDFPQVSATVDAELDCSTDEVTLSGAGSSQGADFVYNWSVVPGTGANLVGSTDELNARANQAGLYVLEVLNTDNQCSATDTVEVIIVDDVVNAAVLETAGINCFGDRDGIITVSEAIGGTPPYTYSFDGGATFGTSNQATGLAPGIYSIVIRDDRGCLHQESITLTEPPLLEVDLGPTVVVDLGESTVLRANVNVDESTIVEWNWSPPLDPTCPNCPEQEFSPERETFVQIEVVDSSGCVATDGVTIVVRVIREVYIPNAFSPNKDGINDFIGVYFDPLRINEIKEFRIFDRWGEQVFMRENIPVYTELNETNAWDGTFRDEPMQPGIFVYYIVIEFADEVEETFQGDFMLIR